MKEKLFFSELLKGRNIDVHSPIKYVRHKDKRTSVFELIEKGFFDDYQSIQKDDIFNCKYIIVFLGLESTKSLFWNVYEVLGKKEIGAVVLPKDFPQEFAEGKTTYDLQKVEGFEDLHDRVVIDWGKGALAWYQNYSDNEKEVLEIRPKGFVKEFPGYLDFTLSFSELKRLFDYADANKVWKDKLSSVNGIYLILDKTNGTQYIGSAYGKDGIWGRWLNYAQTGDGGNKALVELLETQPEYKYNFQWTVLATLPGNLSNDEIIAYETMYKNKLGSKTFGLNRN